jgi:metallophosphoesterase superfamily enzyme
MEWFSRWRNDLPHIEWLLVQGNHDVLHNDWYEANNILVLESLAEDNILFTHEPGSSTLPDRVKGVISGHIHPGINLKGGGRQSISMPCFYFSPNQCILPAFGAFTGIHIIKPKKKDVVFAIANQKIIPLS